MDINSAEKNIKKLLAYVQDLADTKPKMYQKSRGRLKEMADTCKEVVTLISEILQDETLRDDEVEFGSDPNIASELNSMQDKILQIRSFAGVETVEPVSDTATELNAVTAQDVVGFSNKTASPIAKRQILRKYKEVMRKVSTFDFRYDSVYRCAKLLWDWFETRFVKTVYGSDFKYNMKRFPTWIRDIVTMYGKAIRDGEYVELDNKFRLWIDSLTDSDSGDIKYAVPYIVYEFEKSMSPDDMSLEAVVLWDILMDCGLSELCTSVAGDYYLKEDAVYDLCSTLNPGVLDRYVNYVDHPEILSELRLGVLKHA